MGVAGQLQLLSLFSGIGGFELGLERSGGFKTVAQCEIDPYCQKVLAKHWPDVKRYDDIRDLTADTLRRDGLAIDAICGGFPCQDISVAGKGAGIDGERSGLWSEFARLIGELRPRVVFVENVAALLHRGLERVLGDLAALGYDAEWHCIPASAIGAPHRRDRLWIVGYTNQHGQSAGAEHAETSQLCRHGPDPAPMLWPALVRRQPHGDYAGAGDVADADFPRLEGWHSEGLRECTREWTARTSSPLAHTASSRCHEGPKNARGSRARAGAEQGAGPSSSGWWVSEPDVGRVAHGVPKRVDRLRALGNAVVPQIPELLGRAWLAAQAAEPTTPIHPIT